VATPDDFIAIEERLDVNPPLKEPMFRRPFQSRERNDIAAFFRTICLGWEPKLVAVFENFAAQKS
jgi:hypothetical protein